jgi:Tol biopolymer transport system component/predicted amidohydrolase
MTRLPQVVVAATITVAPIATLAETETDSLPLEGSTEVLSFTTDEGSWLSIDVTPEGDSLVFDLLGDLYRLPIEGGEAVRITSGLGYDSQPVISPDGELIAFISDRDGATNLWVANIDGTEARQLSSERHAGMISPQWSSDGDYLIITRVATDTELVMFHVGGGSGVTLTGSGGNERFWGVGVEISPDGEHLYFAEGQGSRRDIPASQISRYAFATGDIEPLTQGEGGAFRPVLSPDGQLMVYGTRFEAQTGLRIRDLVSGADRWLTYPIQRDAQENFRPPSRDLLPGYSFTPDGQQVIFNAFGKILRVDVATGDREEIPFTADVALDIGPDLTAPYRVPQGDLTATLIQDPRPSPDKSKLAASVLTKIYVMDADGKNLRRLTKSDWNEFKPIWSPDGRWIAFTTWSHARGGYIYKMRSDGKGKPRQLTDIEAFYTDLAFSPDGSTIVAMRGNEFLRNQTFSEFGGLRIPLELISLPAKGGEQTVIKALDSGRYPHFGPESDRVYLTGDDGLFSLTLSGTDHRDEMTVNAPRGNRRGDDPPGAEAIYIHPDGDSVLAFANKQVWWIAKPKVGAQAVVANLRGGDVPVKRLTHVGADYLGWSSDGSGVWWAIGNTFHYRPLDSLSFELDDADSEEAVADADDGVSDRFVPEDEHPAVTAIDMDVVVPRSTPTGALLLERVNLISMSAESTNAMAEVRTSQDILIVDNRIHAIGDHGSMAVPDGATRLDLSDKFVVPGFIDTHAHWEFRTSDVLEPHNWSLVANVAYGVTTGLDVQTASNDYLAYRDFVETGQSIGQRAFMTARGVFGDTDFQSYDETYSYLRRYTDHYHTNNIKSYVVGNRQQRQWVVQASQALGLMPTTEGAADQAMNITHAIDGMHGNEHTLPDAPFYKDVVEVFAKTKTAYTPTLVVQYNAPTLVDYFFTRTEVHDDLKLNRFYPKNRLDEMTLRRSGWLHESEFDFKQAAAQVAKIQRAGGLVGIGGHGELQGLAYHWEMWAFAMGGMTPVEVLRAATIDGARIIGVDQDLGSLEIGKLADMVILNSNPLDNIRNTVDIDRVLVNGRLYDGNTMDQEWPDRLPLPDFWWWDEADRRFFP